MYVKFISETQVEKAPVQIEMDNRKYVGFTNEFMASLGYKPLVIEERTLDQDNETAMSTVYESYYVEDETVIYQKWRAVTTG